MIDIKLFKFGIIKKKKKLESYSSKNAYENEKICDDFDTFFFSFEGCFLLFSF